MFFSTGTSTGNFDAAGDQYVGVRFNLNGGADTHFGWVLVNVERSGTQLSVTIKEYAYNTTPDEPILAGDTGIVAVGGVSEAIELDESATLAAESFDEVNWQAIAATSGGALSLLLGVALLWKRSRD